MDERLIRFIEKFIKAQRRCTNQFQLDGLADEGEKLLAEVKHRDGWPKGWIIDRPFMSERRRYRVSFMENEQEDSISIYAGSEATAFAWLKAKGVERDRVVFQKL